MKKTLGLIDYFKFAFAIGVVMIHANCFEQNDMGSWIILHGLLRLAVPFFFCVSGFFLYKSLEKEKNEKIVRSKYIKRLLLPFIFWLIANLPLVIMQYVQSGNGLKEIVLKIGRGLLFYPWGALWYISALIVAILIVIPFYKKNKLKTIMITSMVLYLLGLIFNTYYFIIDGTLFQKIVDTILKIVVSMRNGLFEGLFFVSAGMYVAQLEKRKLISKNTNIILLIASYALLIIEIVLTKNLAHTDDHSLFISFIVLIPSLVMLLARYKTNRDTRLMRNFSTGIYFSHRFILAIVTLFILKNSDNAWAIFGLTLALDLLLLSILYKMKNEKINKLIT